MQHTKLFNPEFGEEFEIGKDVKHIISFEYVPKTYETLKAYFDYKQNSNELLELEVDEIYDAFKIIRDGFIMPEDNYKLHKEFFSDYINILKRYISDVENNREIYDNALIGLKPFGFLAYVYIDDLREKGIDLYPVYVKTLKNIVSDLESRAKQLFQNLDSEKINNIMNELSKQIYSNETDIEIKTLDLFLELLKEGRFNNIINLFAKTVFPSIYEEKGRFWYMNSPNQFTKILANEFANKIKKSGENISEKELNLFSIRLLTEIWNREKLYFDDKDKHKLFINTFIKYNAKIGIGRFNKLFFNPDALKYIHPDFLKQFKDFNDFVENSGIKKDGDYFSMFYYFGMLYDYNNQLAKSSEYDFHDVRSFGKKLKNVLPIQKNHIKNYTDIQQVSLYKLNPAHSSKDTDYYERKKLIKYFGIGNSGSCVRGRLSDERREIIGISNDVSFILLTDENGKTIGRFIEMGDDTFFNLHYNKMAYETAFRMSGEKIISEYLNKYKNINDDFEFEYEDLTRNPKTDKGQLIKQEILNHMKDMKQIFHVNDYIKVNRKK